MGGVTSLHSPLPAMSQVCLVFDHPKDHQMPGLCKFQGLGQQIFATVGSGAAVESGMKAWIPESDVT